MSKRRVLKDTPNVWHCTDIPYYNRQGGSLAAFLPGISRFSRRQMYEASRRRLGITRERLALVETAFGSAAVTTLEAHNMGQALDQIIASKLPFDRWYREQVQELHGVNLAGYEVFLQPAPPSENQELLFEWTLSSSMDE
jgi:hypothetical protein